MTFLLPVPDVERIRRGPIDLYGVGAVSRPAVVLVHGGPVAPDADPEPREWFAPYAALLAARGVVGVTFTHRLYSADHAPVAADDLAAAVEAARAVDGIDAARIGIWCFSMGGVLAASWLASPPPWLRVLAWNYPVLAPGPDWEGDVPRFDCVGAVGAAPELPKVLVRVEHEFDFCVPVQVAFVAAAEALTVVDVPGAHHPFEDRDHTDDTRAALVTALDLVAAALD